MYVQQCTCKRKHTPVFYSVAHILKQNLYITLISSIIISSMLLYLKNYVMIVSGYGGTHILYICGSAEKPLTTSNDNNRMNVHFIFTPYWTH